MTRAPAPDQPGRTPKALGVILAGKRPSTDPLASVFGKPYKALVPVRGRPMIHYVIEALAKSGCVERIVVLTQEPDVLSGVIETAPVDGVEVSVQKSNGGISKTVSDFLSTVDFSRPVFIVTADSCLLTQDAVKSFLDISAAHDSDFTVGLVDRADVEKVPVQTKRTWITFRDRHVTGCNMFLARSARVHHLLEFWATVEQSRKKVSEIARKLGVLVLLRYSFGLLRLNAAFDHASKKFGLRVAPILMSDGRLAIDADKPDDLTAIEHLLASGQGS